YWLSDFANVGRIPHKCLRVYGHFARPHESFKGISRAVILCRGICTSVQLSPVEREGLAMSSDNHLFISYTCHIRIRRTCDRERSDSKWDSFEEYLHTS